MNELALSNDLNVITAEINSYKQVAGHSFVEIGKRLIHVKENDLTHGDWKPFLERIQMSKSQADRFMKISKEYEIGKLPNVGNIGFSAMYEIATLPEDQREQAFNADGSAKSVREIQELKQRNKQLEQEKKQAEQDNQKLGQLLTEERNKEPKVIEKEVVKEVIPNHVKEQIEERERIYKATVREYEQLQDELNLLKAKTASDNEKEKKEKEVKLLMLDASKSVLKTKIKIDEFLQEVAVTPYRRGAIASSSEGTKNKLREGVNELKAFCEEMEMALDGTIEHQK